MPRPIGQEEDLFNGEEIEETEETVEDPQDNAAQELGRLRQQNRDLEARLAMMERRIVTSDPPKPEPKPEAQVDWDKVYSDPKEFYAAVTTAAKEKAKAEVKDELKQELRAEARTEQNAANRQREILGKALARLVKADSAVVNYYQSKPFMLALSEVEQRYSDSDKNDPEKVFEMLREANRQFRDELGQIPGLRFEKEPPPDPKMRTRPDLTGDSDVPIIRKSGKPRWDDAKSVDSFYRARSDRKSGGKTPPRSGKK